MLKSDAISVGAILWVALDLVKFLDLDAEKSRIRTWFLLFGGWMFATQQKQIRQPGALYYVGNNPGRNLVARLSSVWNRDVDADKGLVTAAR